MLNSHVMRGRYDFTAQGYSLGSSFEAEATVADRLLDLQAQPSLIQRRNDQKTNKSLIVGGEILIEWLVIGIYLDCSF
jgi:hypothetical protein